MATWAKGLDFKNSNNTARIGGVGIYGTDTAAQKIYIGFGTEPWNNAGLQVTTSGVNFKGNKVYHAGDKPTAADVGALTQGTADGRYMRQVSANGYYGMTSNGDTSQWVRTTTQGIIPYQSGGASSLGTSSWPFSNIYGNNIYDNGVLLEDKFAAKSHGMHTASKSINATFSTEFRTQTKGNASSGEYITTIRNDAASVANSPQYGTGLAWGRSDTHGYIYMNYNSAQAYIGAGNADKLNWVKELAFKDSSITGNASTATTLQTARTINGTSFNGSANITTANWGTSRTLTIGNTGKSVNGSGNVSWSLSEIGAAAASHSHSYLPLSGGTMTGIITTSTSGALKDASGNIFLRNNDNGATILSNSNGTIYFRAAGDTNSTGQVTVSSTGTVTAPTFVGALSGNAKTATTLQTARTLTIGNTGKSFNGSANVSWSLSDIGAAASSHTHTELWTRDGFNANASGFQRPNSSGLPYGLAIHVKHPTQSNAAYSRGIGFHYGDSLDIFTYAYSPDASKRTEAQIYTTSFRPHSWGTGAPNNSDGKPDGHIYFRYA